MDVYVGIGAKPSQDILVPFIEFLTFREHQGF